jgi:glycosyltransferase involved in cell wall biosynthesis
MLGLAQSLPDEYQSIFLSFSENHLCLEFLDEARRRGFTTIELEHDTPWFRAATLELTENLSDLDVDILCCHGYKANLLGRIAARRAGVSVVAVSRGWTGESPKVRFYESVDRACLRWMDRVVSVSQAQANKVRKTGVPERKVVVIPNAIATARFEGPDPTGRAELEQLFPGRVQRIVGAAGRLSPEKGFDVLIDAAAAASRSDASIGFVLFGDGGLRNSLAARVADRGLSDRFLLAGFRTDLDHLIPHLDLLVIPSYTEGLPNVALEACAAGVPVVATDVGGNPEVITDGWNGFLVPPGNPAALSRRIVDALSDEEQRLQMGRRGRARVVEEFGFEGQARAYRRLFDVLRQPEAGLALVSSDRTGLELASAPEGR